MSRSWFVLLATAVFFSGLSPVHATPDTTNLRGQLALATGDKDTLSRIELLRRILDTEPGDRESHQLLVELWLQIQDYDRAESALQAWPDAPPRLVALARADILHRRDQDLDGAIRVLQQYITKSPGDAGVLEVLVQDLLGTNDLKAQLRALEKLIAVRRDATNLIRRANVKLQLGNYPGALADAKAAQKLEPDAAIVKGSVPQFERLEEALKALPALDRALAKNPDDFDALLDRGWWHRYGGMLDLALADAEAAAKLQPRSLMARLDVTRALYLLHRLKAEDALRDELIDVTQPLALEDSRAIAACDLAVIADPNDAAKIAARAAALNDALQYRLARRDADAALALDPKAAEAALAAMTSAFFLGDDQGAATLLRQVEAMRPDRAALARAEGAMAESYLEKSNLPLALELAQKSLALEETRHVTKVKAAALQRLNRTQEAEAAFARAKKLPDDEQ